MRLIPPLLSAAARAANFRPNLAAKGCLCILLTIGLASNVSAIEWTTGAPGGSTPNGGLDFKGGNGPESFVDIPGLDMLNEFSNWESDYTMALWVSPDLIPGESFFLGQTNQGIHHGLRNGGKLHQAHWGADHSGDTTVPTGPASDPNSWVHATYTWDWEAQEAQIYFNGDADTADPVSKRAPNGDGNFIIGSRNGAGGPAFDGQIDEVAVWNTILPRGNITALANGAPPSNFGQGSLVGYWDFEEGDGFDVGDKSGNEFDGVFEPEPPPPPPVFPAERLAGPAGTEGNWGTIDYFDFGGATITAPAEAVVQQILDVQNGDLEPGVTETGAFPALHHSDPDNAGGQGGKLDNATIEPFPGEEPGVDDNDFIHIAHGRLNVQEAGEYTIGIESDDGFGLRIFGAEFTQVSGGEIDPQDPTNSTVLFRGNTGNSNTRALVTLQEGTYTAEYFMWERGGGAYNEVASASGNHMPGQSSRTQWLALGDGSILDERVEVPGEDDPSFALLTGPADIRVFDLAQEDQPIEFAREVMLENFDDPDAQDESDRVQMDDHNINNGGCPFGAFNADGNQPSFPDGTRNYGSANEDDFGSVMTGTFTVSDYDGEEGETLPMHFHIDSDDRSAFHILGNNFEDVANGDDFFYDFDGDEAIGDDSNTCNTNYDGLIMLTEGEEYTFQLFHTERGGDAGFQVLAGINEDEDVFVIPDDMRLVATGDPGDPIVFPRNVGIGLVMEDPNNTDPDIMGGLEGDYDGSGVLDLADINLQAAEMKEANPDLALFDHNDDGAVNEADRTIWVKELRNTWVGDANLDSEFNSGDLVAVFAAGKYESGQMAGWEEGDWSGDMVFDSGDLVVAFADGGYEQGAPPAPAAVPEPSSLVLALLSVMGLIGIVRRK